jgi:predicted transcriptional regulator
MELKENPILKYFENLFSEIPNLKVVIIDMLGSSSLMQGMWTHNYFKENAMMNRLHQIALKRNISIIVVHHTRNMKSDNFTDDVSGTVGLIGPDASTWVMEAPRFSDKCTLKISGKYQPQKAYQLEFDEELGELKYVGEKIEIEMTPSWEKIYKIFQQNSDQDELSSSFISKLHGTSQSNISIALRRMKKKDIVVNGSKRGYYKLARPPEKLDLQDIQDSNE